MEVLLPLYFTTYLFTQNCPDHYSQYENMSSYLQNKHGVCFKPTSQYLQYSNEPISIYCLTKMCCQECPQIYFAETLFHAGENIEIYRNRRLRRNRSNKSNKYPNPWVGHKL